MTAAPLGLMGGTFDPVHHAHLRLAVEAAEQLGLDEVRWIPSGDPGHRARPLTSAEHRLAMLRLAIADEPRFTLDAAEIHAPTPTYTVNTLARLRDELGSGRPLVMIIGMDSFLSLPTWKDWRQLFDHTHFAVGERPGFVLDPARLDVGLAQALAQRAGDANSLRASAHGSIARFSMMRLDISSTELRARMSRGNDVRYLLPETVLRYIGSHGLYR